MPKNKWPHYMKGKVDTYGHCQGQETRVGTMVATAREFLSKLILLVALEDFLMRTYRYVIMSNVYKEKILLQV